MRAFIFLAIVGVAYGNLCRGVLRTDVDRAFATARVAATTILGRSCPTFDLDRVAFSGECRTLVRQATCYGIRTARRYEATDRVTYGTLEESIPDLERLGNLACDQAPRCYEQVRAAMQTCMDRNPNFINDTIRAAETAYRNNFEDTMAEFARTNKGSLLGDVVNMATGTTSRILWPSSPEPTRDLFLETLSTWLWNSSPVLMISEPSLIRT